MALRWQDVDLKRGLLTVKRSLARVSVEGGGKRTQLAFLNPKTRAGQRVVPIPEKVLKELKAHKARQNAERLFFGGEYENKYFAPKPAGPLTLGTSRGPLKGC